MIEVHRDKDELSWTPETARYWFSLGLPTYICNALSHAGIKSKEELTALGEQEFTRITNIGQKAVDEVRPITGWPDTRKPPLHNIKTELLVNELRRRGWTVKEPEGKK